MLLEQVPLDDLGLDFLNPARGAGGFDKGFEFPLPDVIIDPLAGFDRLDSDVDDDQNERHDDEDKNKKSHHGRGKGVVPREFFSD